MINKDRFGNFALATDLYELTMAACYFENSMFKPATFSLFIREYPPSRFYFISAGLADVVDYLENFRFRSEDLEYLESLKLFKPQFLSYLEGLRFAGEVFAIPEGRIFFVNEPVLEVTASLIEAQIIETFLINTVNLQTMIATKASRCVHAAWPRKLVDFSFRRTHGIDTGLKVARASYIGGFLGTSNVLAGKVYGLPVYGTMAHSFITCFNHEMEAFRAFVRTFPENSILLVDTYDTLSGAEKAARIGKEMERRGERLKGVRLDSGDMASLSQQVRKILEKSKLDDAMIFASGGFDEYRIRDVLGRGGDIDSFGVGTRMGVSSDAPYFDMAYKLVKYDGRPVLKLSPGKETLVNEKQVFRFTDAKGKLRKDVIGLRDEKEKGGQPLLRHIMHKGKAAVKTPSLPQIQKIFFDDISRLEECYKSIDGREKKYPVHFSSGLKELQKCVVSRLRDDELGES